MDKSKPVVANIPNDISHRVMVMLYGEDPDFEKAFNKAVDMYMVGHFVKRPTHYVAEWISKYIQENYHVSEL